MEHLPPPLLVSGNSPDALAAAADRLREEVASVPEETLRDLRHRSLTTVHAHRRGAVLATDRDGLLRGLTALAQGRTGRDILTGTADVAREPVLVFPGQGASWPGMAAELRRVLARIPGADRVLRPDTERPPGRLGSGRHARRGSGTHPARHHPARPVRPVLGPRGYLARPRTPGDGGRRTLRRRDRRRPRLRRCGHRGRHPAPRPVRQRTHPHRGAGRDGIRRRPRRPRRTAAPQVGRTPRHRRRQQRPQRDGQR